MGRVANYSSLKKQRPAEYRIHEAGFTSVDAHPRFVLRPFNADAAEGQTVSFFTKILSPSMPLKVGWWRDGQELTATGSKYTKNANGNDYALTIR